MEKIFESFFIGGKKVGGIVRLLEPTKLSTLTCFQIPDGPLIHLEHRFFFEGSPLDWDRYTFHEYHSTKTTEFKRKTGNAIPSYAAFLLLRKMIDKKLTRLDFEMLIDGDPVQAPKVATLQVEGAEEVTFPSGGKTIASRVPLYVDGKPGNAHWIANDEVIKSDWQGAESYRANDIDDVLDGLNQSTAVILRTFTLEA